MTQQEHAWNKQEQQEASGAKQRKTPKHITELNYRIIAIFKDSVDKLNNRKKEKQNKAEERERKSTPNLKIGQKKLLK